MARPCHRPLTRIAQLPVPTIWPRCPSSCACTSRLHPASFNHYRQYLNPLLLPATAAFITPVSRSATRARFRSGAMWTYRAAPSQDRPLGLRTWHGSPSHCFLPASLRNGRRTKLPAVRPVAARCQRSSWPSVLPALDLGVMPTLSPSRANTRKVSDYDNDN